MLIALPRGLCVSGVTMWAVRLANALVREGGAAGLIVHAEDQCHACLEVEIDPRVRRFDLTDLSALDRCGGDLSAYIPRYRDAVGAMAGEGPVVLSPNLLGDCYAIGAALTQVIPERVRIVGWQHSDIAYDARVLAHYAPCISRFVGVSGHIAGSLREQVRDRARDVIQVPYGVELGDRPAREPIGRRPLRLLYTGRIEHPQKRIGELVHLADELCRRGIDHELTLLGDGPAAEEIDALCAERPTIRRIGAQSPSAVRTHLARSDVFVLSSRYEGLSVSMLEALAAGCVPVMTRVRSGASEAVADGETGVLVPGEPDDERAIAKNLADGVERALAIGLDCLSANAHRVACERFSIQRHVSLVRSMLGEVAASPARPWPVTRACAFTGASAGGSPILPPQGPGRMRQMLEALAGRRIAIHGAGRHTIELAPVLAAAPCTIVAICDDDPARWCETLLGWPIISPREAGELDVSDIVISSHMHEQDIWLRRGRLPQGVTLHRLYASSDARGSEIPAAA